MLVIASLILSIISGNVYCWIVFGCFAAAVVLYNVLVYLDSEKHKEEIEHLTTYYEREVDYWKFEAEYNKIFGKYIDSKDESQK